MWERRRGIPLFIGDKPSHWKDATNQTKPRGTSLEERNDIMNEPRDCTMCQHLGQGLKKKIIIKSKSNHHKSKQQWHTTQGQKGNWWGSMKVNPSLDVIHDQSMSKENNLRIGQQHLSLNNEVIQSKIPSWTTRYMDKYIYMHRWLNYT